MDKTKKWYQMKLVWLGVFITFQGFIPLLIELANSQELNAVSILTALSGMTAVVLRVWFTSNTLE